MREKRIIDRRRSGEIILYNAMTTPSSQPVGYEINDRGGSFSRWRSQPTGFLFFFIKLTRMIGPAGLSFIWNVKMIPKQEGIYLASDARTHRMGGCRRV